VIPAPRPPPRSHHGSSQRAPHRDRSVTRRNILSVDPTLGPARQPSSREPTGSRAPTPAAYHRRGRASQATSPHAARNERPREKFRLSTEKALPQPVTRVVARPRDASDRRTRRAAVRTTAAGNANHARHNTTRSLPLAAQTGAPDPTSRRLKSGSERTSKTTHRYCLTYARSASDAAMKPPPPSMIDGFAKPALRA
jgi:hypothetical protein